MSYLSPEYRAYIDSDKWQEVRARKLKEVGERCQKCRKWRYQLTRPRILQVHHLNYDRLGHELMSDLQVLCVPCHEKATKKARRRRQLQKWLTG